MYAGGKLLLLPIYTNILSTEEYGAVDLIITYTALLLPLVTLQLEQALFRFLLDKREIVVELETFYLMYVHSVF